MNSMAEGAKFNAPWGRFSPAAAGCLRYLFLPFSGFSGAAAGENVSGSLAGGGRRLPEKNLNNLLR